MTGEATAGDAPRRRAPLLLVVPLVVIFGTAALGNALFPVLVNEHPLLLLALNATARHMIATSTSVDVVPFAVVALLRRLIEDPFLYLLGRRYGDGAVEWMSRRLGGGRVLRAAQRNYRYWGLPLVALFPGGVVCVLAGASGMPFVRFLVVDLLGTAATIWLLRSTGQQLSAPLGDALMVIADNVLLLTSISVVVTAVALLRRRRRRGPSDAAELARLEALRRRDGT